eukprot:scaffold5198_cov173-Amphora_coffeaeformis.AAC.2
MKRKGKSQSHKKESSPSKKRAREEAKPATAAVAAEKSDRKDVPSEDPKDAAIRLKQYACLGEECESLFPMWSTARKHMKECSKFESDKKPTLKESAAKAQQVLTSKPELKAELEAEVLANPTPWEDVSEDELVQVVREYYAKVGWDKVKMKKHVVAHAIRPKYGNFPFGKFGFGSFREWSKKHGLGVYDKTEVDGKESEEEEEEEEE